MFADDTTAIVRNNTRSGLETDINQVIIKIKNWFHSNWLKVIYKTLICNMNMALFMLYKYNMKLTIPTDEVRATAVNIESIILMHDLS